MIKEAFAFFCTSYNDLADCGQLATFLHPCEIARIQNAGDKRKAEFFCGRICAKRAAARVIGGSGDIRDIPILNDCRGAPYFEDGRLSVSITHGDSLAAALVTDRARLLAGVDLQKVTVRGAKVIGRTLKGPEKVLVAQYSGQFGQNFCATAVWVAKEAASKLLGYGFSLFEALEVSGFEGGESVQVRFKNFAGLTVVIRPYQDFLFGFAVEKKNAELFFAHSFEIQETPLALLKNP